MTKRERSKFENYVRGLVLIASQNRFYLGRHFAIRALAALVLVKG